MRLRGVVSVAVVAVLAGACGDDGDGSLGDAATTVAVETTASDRDPALDKLALCETTDRVSEAFAADAGSETMTSADYAVFVPAMIEALDELIAIDPPDNVRRAAEDLLDRFEAVEGAFDAAPTPDGEEFPSDEDALAAMLEGFPEGEYPDELVLAVTGEGLNCS